MTDWKIPTIEQMLTLTNNTCTNPATYHPFDLQPNGKYWSSSTQQYRGRLRSIIFNSANGASVVDADGRPTPLYVLCVHDAPSSPPANCTTQTVQGYRVDMLYHNGARRVYKSFPGSPPNGTTNYTATAKCNNGTITITGEQ